MDFLAGKDVTVVVPFRVDGEYVVPDVSSVTYTLRDNAGVIIAGQEDQAVTTTTNSTEIAITLPSSVNAKTKTFENRHLQVDFKVGGKPYTYRTSYRLIDFIAFTATPNDVRNALGVEPDELPDTDIDLIAAYYEIGDRVNLTTFNTALADGSTKTVWANRAITYQAAIHAIPSLVLRIAQEEGTDSTKYRRFSDIDFAQLQGALSRQLAAALDLSVDRTEVTPLIAFGATRTDPVTGA